MLTEPVARFGFLVYHRRFLNITHIRYNATFRGFDAYWPRPFINRMLNADLLVEGCLRYTSPNLAYVVNPSDGNRIFIFAKALNRAFPNDIVAVKLNGPDQWRVRASLEESEDEPSRAATPVVPAEAEEELLDESAEDPDPLSSPSPPRFQLTVDTSLEARDPGGGGIYPTVREVLQNSPSLLSRLFPEAKSVTELVLQEQKPLMPLPSQHLLRTGRVVGVLCENSAGRRLVGHLVFESALLLPSAFVEVEDLDESARPRQGVVEGFDGLPTMVPNASCFFVPESPNFPRIKLAPSSVPDDLWENPHKAEGVRYICKVQGWSPSSPYPNGVLCGQIGNPKEIEPATREILLSHGIHEDDFTHEMLKCLPASEADFQIPNYEYLRRRDFRSHCVVSVDPSTAKDLDDALHIRLCAKDTFEVGVHIADVSFFVRPMTPLDREAANRTTSIYLVQRAIPMLPAILSEHLCSLNPGVDRLAFSVVFKVDKEANIFNVWFGRTVIRSCARLSYEDAMALLETPREDLDSLASRIPIHGPFSLGNVKRSLTYLDMLAQKMRKRRIDSGALHLEKVQLQFDLVPTEAEASEPSTASNEAGGRRGAPAEERNSSGPSNVLPAGWPRGYVVKKRDRAHHLIEEWMLAANEAVARRLFYHVIKQKHREVLLTADSDSVNTAAITAAIGSSAICSAETEKSKGLRSSAMGTILRRHPPPRTAKMQQLVKIADCAGISMDVSSAGALRASLDNYIAKLLEEGAPQSKVDCLSTALSYLTYMRMQMALYFNVEDVVDRAIRKRRSMRNAEKSPPSPRETNGSWESSLLAFSHHFGLNVPLYTHFTSPIRRYADLLVHRQLADLLGCGHWSCPRPSSLSSSSDGPPPAACPPRRPTVQAAWCNRMRRETRRAQEKSQQLFFAAWIKSSGLVQESAVVLDVTRSRIQLLIPSCGLVINHQLQTFCRGASDWQLEDRSAHTSAPRAPCVTVRWESGKTGPDEEGEGDAAPLPTTKLSVFSVCQVGLTCSSRGFYVKAELLPPHASQPAT